MARTRIQLETAKNKTIDKIAALQKAVKKEKENLDRINGELAALRGEDSPKAE